MPVVKAYHLAMTCSCSLLIEFPREEHSYIQQQAAYEAINTSEVCMLLSNINLEGFQYSKAYMRRILSDLDSRGQRMK